MAMCVCVVDVRIFVWVMTFMSCCKCLACKQDVMVFGRGAAPTGTILH